MGCACALTGAAGRKGTCGVGERSGMRTGVAVGRGALLLLRTPVGVSAGDPGGVCVCLHQGAIVCTNPRAGGGCWAVCAGVVCEAWMGAAEGSAYSVMVCVTGPVSVLQMCMCAHVYILGWGCWDSGGSVPTLNTL